MRAMLDVSWQSNSRNLLLSICTFDAYYYEKQGTKTRYMQGSVFKPLAFSLGTRRLHRVANAISMAARIRLDVTVI